MKSVPRLTPAVLFGLLLTLALGLVATAIGNALPLLGGPVAGVLLGLLVAVFFRPIPRRPSIAPGVGFSSSVLLRIAVVLLGAQVSLAQVFSVGRDSFPVMIGTLVAALAAAFFLGRALKLDSHLTTLIGVGTAICGASAIAAITPILRPAAAKVAYALSTVFMFNIAAVLVFPWLGHALGMGEIAFGIFAGTAVNDTSSVVAAATVYGPIATDTAVVVKLARTLMIIPIAIGLALLTSRKSTDGATRPKASTLLPWFLLGFIVLAALNPLLPAWAISGAGVLATYFITVALTAIGLSTNLPALARTGGRPILLGALLWVVVSGTSLLIQSVTTGLTV